MTFFHLVNGSAQVVQSYLRGQTNIIGAGAYAISGAAVRISIGNTFCAMRLEAARNPSLEK